MIGKASNDNTVIIELNPHEGADLLFELNGMALSPHSKTIQILDLLWKVFRPGVDRQQAKIQEWKDAAGFVKRFLASHDKK